MANMRNLDDMFRFSKNGTVLLGKGDSSITRIRYNDKTYLVRPDKEMIKKILELFLEDLDMKGIIDIDNEVSKIDEKL